MSSSVYGLEPSIQVNGSSVFIVPGTWAFTQGHPEIDTKTLSNGRNNFKIYRTQDSSTAFCTFKFDLPATPDSIQLLNIWKENNGELQVIATDVVNDQEAIITIHKGSIDNNPEIESGSDAKISIEGTGLYIRS